MAISTKNKRKLVFEEKEYIWYVKEDLDLWDELTLTIISQDKKIHLFYRLERNKLNIVESYGKVFQNIHSFEIPKFFICPFEPILPITPKFVSNLIMWAVHGKDAIRVPLEGKNGTELTNSNNLSLTMWVKQESPED